MVVMAIRTSGTNADLIADAAELGYLDWNWDILDATWGKGNFWTKWSPRLTHFLTKNDLYVPEAEFNYDFRAFPPEWEERFRAVVFDPPYKLQGTSSNAGPASSNASYGMDREYQPTESVYALYCDGVTECARVLKPGGFLLVKCMDQVVSGRVEWMSIAAANHGHLKLGLDLVDTLMLMGHRAQPERTRKCPECRGEGGGYLRTGAEDWEWQGCDHCQNTGRVPSPQQHAARNYSSLLVFRKGR